MLGAAARQQPPESATPRFGRAQVAKGLAGLAPFLDRLIRPPAGGEGFDNVSILRLHREGFTA